MKTKIIILIVSFMLFSAPTGAESISIIGSFYDDNLASTGWMDFRKIEGRTICLATAISSNSITAIDYTKAAEPVKLSQIVDANNLRGSEYVQYIDDLWAINTAIYSNAFNKIDISDPGAIRIDRTIKDDRIKGAAGCVAVDGLWGRNKVIFVAGYQGFSIAAVDYDTWGIITNVYSESSLNGPINLAFYKNRIYAVCRWGKCISYFDVSEKNTIVYIGSLTDDRGRFERLGGLAGPVDGRLYLPDSVSNSLNIVDITALNSIPYIEGSVSSTLIEGPYVPEVVGNFAIFSGRYCNSIAVADCRDRTNPAILMDQVIRDDALLNGPDDVQYFDGICYASCTVGKTITAIKIPILDQTEPNEPPAKPMIIKKVWSEPVDLASGRVPPDGRYYFTPQINNENGAEIYIEYQGDGTFDSLIAAIFGGNEPTEIYEFSNDGFSRNAKISTEISSFRVGLKCSGRKTSFDYKINFRTWHYEIEQ